MPRPNTGRTCGTAFPKSTEPDRRAEAEEKRSRRRRLGLRAAREGRRPPPNPGVGSRSTTAWQPPRVCTKLSGPWAEEIDATAAALPLHEPLGPDGRRVLLEGDGKAFVLDKSLIGERTDPGDRQRFVPVERGGSSRRRAGRWPSGCSNGPGAKHQRIALVEGSYVLAGAAAPPSLWDLLKRLPTLRWVAIQLGLAGLLAALARAPRLGRPRPDPASGADRPGGPCRGDRGSARAAGRRPEARELLDRYRHWRHPQAALMRSRSSAGARADTRARPRLLPPISSSSTDDG